MRPRRKNIAHTGRIHAFILTVCAAVVALLVGGCAVTVDNAPPEVSGSGSVQSDAEKAAATFRAAAMRCLYYERDFFLSAVSAPREYEIEGRLVAGTVPHHLIASDMITGFFLMAASNPEGYDSVLIISPSHFPENSKNDIITSTAGWDSPYGPVSADVDIIRELMRNPVISAEDNPAAVELDHGAAGLVPFVKYYLPDVKIAACLLPNKLDKDRSAAVGMELASLCRSGRMLLVASLDCSHYLTPEQAAIRDLQTREAVEMMDIRRILEFDDSNVDSPQALTAFVETARIFDASLELLDHSSSVEKLPQALSNPAYREGVTTYLVYAAHKHS